MIYTHGPACCSDCDRTYEIAGCLQIVCSNVPASDLYRTAPTTAPTGSLVTEPMNATAASTGTTPSDPPAVPTATEPTTSLAASRLFVPMFPFLASKGLH